VIDWLRSLWPGDQRRPRSQSLQERIAFLTAAAVAAAVAVTGVAAFFITKWSLYAQLDRQLIDIASATSKWIGNDMESMGGVNTDALRAADVTLLVLRSDNEVRRIPDEDIVLETGSDELAIARLQTGSSARSGVATNGQAYRIVAVPLQSGNDRWALVIGRPLAPTNAVLSSLWVVLTVFGLVGVFLGGLAGWLISRSSLQPVRQLTTAVTRITETDELEPIDISGNDELTELSRSFNTMLHSLASSRDRQRRLIADAGHELRTPLTSMRTNIELLVADEKSGMLPPGARGEILRDAAAQLAEFTNLVGDLVQLSRDDRVQPAPEPVDLREVVTNAITRAKRRGPNLNFDVELNPLYLMGEPDTLERAITNLLDNAVKFSPAGGTIRVLLEGDRLRISDKGPGIAEEDLPHIFDRFYRSDRARNTPGTGLGLSIVAHTINAHGGWVKAGRSAEGGAEFTVYLPGTSTYEDADEDTQIIKGIRA